MDQEPHEKQMSSTNRKCIIQNYKEKIFNVRKVHYKQFDNEKYIKGPFSPFNNKELVKEPIRNQNLMTDKITKKGGQYNFQVAIISSSAYKELAKKYAILKQQQNFQKQKRLNQFKEKENELNKFKSQKQRIDCQRQKLQKRRDQLKMRIQQIRDRNQALREEQIQRNEEYRMMNMEYLKNLIIGMRYQNGVQIDPDNMTYEELLQLQEKMGSVSKGLTEQQYNKLPTRICKQGDPEQLCSICYYNAKQGQTINTLPCKHSFHSDCIKEWLAKQKVCPMCKQQIILKIQSTKNLIESMQKNSKKSLSKRNIQSQSSSNEINFSSQKIQQSCPISQEELIRA